MVFGFFIIIACLLLGELTASLAGISIPGSVLGMIILFIGLVIKGSVPDEIEAAGGGLLKNIGLLFVPAGAGISMFLSLLVEEWDVILIASVSSTILTLMSCAIIFRILDKKAQADD